MAHADELPTAAAAAESNPTQAVQVLEALRVTATRADAADSIGPEPIEHYGEEQIYDTGAFNLNEFIDSLPPADGGNEVLVLIDGQPAYIDPASLPLSMIESIEVSRDGSMPEHGAYANGQVINIRTKKDYRGGEIGEKNRGTFAGGGAQENVKLSGAASRGKLRAFFSLDHTQTHALAATQREFSSEQDHTALGGRDFRLAWGYPAVVYAVAGNLTGLTDSAGNPVNVALAPETQRSSALTPADFIPGAGPAPMSAANQRRFNTAAYRLLVAPSNRTGGNLSFTYALATRAQLSVTATYAETSSERTGAPPVTPASSSTVVPAALNPFNQDIEIGLVHVGFGPVRQSSQATTGQLGVKVNGRIGDTWSWNAGIAHRRSATEQTATDLDQENFKESLAASDPAQRFDPFGDFGKGSKNAQLYPLLSVVRARRDTNRDTRLDLAAHGKLVESWGGPLTLSLRGNGNIRQQTRVTTHPTLGLAPETHQQRASATLSTAISIPLVGVRNALPFIRRLDAQVSTRFSQQDDDGGGRDTAVGVVWAPLKSFGLRAKYSESTTAPPHTIVAGATTLVNETLIDPARNDEPTSNAEIFNRDTVIAVSAHTTRASLGASLEPALLKGFHFSASYDVRQRHNILQQTFDPQEIINNEAVFPGRVIRTTRDPTRSLGGLPGNIVAVDVTPGNSGEAESRDIDFSLQYLLPWQEWGRFRISAFARRILESRYEIAPGVRYVHESSSDLNPPDWTFQSLASWNRLGWNASVRWRYTGPVVAGNSDDPGIPAIMTMDLNLGYRFQRAFWGQMGRGLRVAIGLENVFDRPPPFADTISGYRGGSPLGRTYSCAVTVPW